MKRTKSEKITKTKIMIRPPYAHDITLTNIAHFEQYNNKKHSKLCLHRYTL